jgi:ABC-type nitrate/sulfonate/bicarbonate transport system substrate-binding protein
MVRPRSDDSSAGPRVGHRRRAARCAALGLALALGTACAPASGGPPSAAKPPAAAAPGQPTSARAAPSAPAAPPAEPDKLSETITTFAFSYWPTMVAQAKGFLKARGIEVELVVTPRIPDSARALAAGSHQVGSFIPDTALLAVAQGASMSLVGIETDRAIYRLAVQPSVTSFADLRGKTFAVGAINDVTAGMLRRTLRLNGVLPDEYEIVGVGSTPERYAAVQSGHAIGVLLTPPLNLRAEREGFKMLANLAEILPPYTFAALMVNRDWAQGNRGAVARWLAAMQDSVRWLYDPANKEEAIAILAEWTRTSEDDARGTYGIVIEQDKAYPADLRATRAHLEAMIDLMREVGTAPDPMPDLDRFLDNSYLDEAQRLGPAGR